MSTCRLVIWDLATTPYRDHQRSEFHDVPGRHRQRQPDNGAASCRGQGTACHQAAVAVSAVLDELTDFVSTQELHRILQERGTSVSLATSYRILQSLADEGLVDVLRNADGEAVYRRCAVTGHHHHLLCRSCGKAVEVEAPAVESWAARTATEHGFTAVEHTVEIFGLCPECTARTTA